MEPVARRIAGLDLSTKRIGYADPAGGLHSLKARAGAEDPARRLYELIREIDRIVKIYPPAPDIIVIEDYSLGSPGRISLIRLGEIGGCARLRLFELDIPYHEIRPSSLKLFATGKGNADKEKMIAAAIRLGARGSVNDDEADAFHLRRVGLAVDGQLGAFFELAPHEQQALETIGIDW